MHYLLYQIGGRLLGLGVIVYFGRVLRRAWAERKITDEHYTDILGFWPLKSTWVYERDRKPVMYWMTFVGNAFLVFCGVVLTLVGWTPSKP